MAHLSKINKPSFISGDWNADLLKSDSHNDSMLFFETVTSFSFKPTILQPTRVTSSSSTSIDNIFVNEPGICSVAGNLTCTISDHFPQFSIFEGFQNDLDTNFANTKKRGRSYRDFNQNEFKFELGNIDWHSIFLNKNGNECCQLFFKKIEHLLDEMAPYKTLSRKECNLYTKPWLTSGILRSINIRDLLHKQYLKEQNMTKKKNLFIKYKKRRNIITYLIRLSKKSYYKSLFDENISDMKKMWKNIKDIVNVNKKSQTSAKSVVVNNRLISDKHEVVNEFNKFYTEVGTNIDRKIPQVNTTFEHYLDNPCLNSFIPRIATDNEIRLLILQLDVTKACGPTSIPNKLLNLFADVLSPPLTLITNNCLQTGMFPDSLKLANIIPIFKKGATNLCCNYRPISLLSNVSKILEKVMHIRLYAFLEDHKLIYKNQYGFRQKYSTEHAITHMIELIKNKLDNKRWVGAVFLDLEKAFDTVNHQILLKKLYHYGIRGIPLKWFESYLSNRQQRTVLNNSESSFKQIVCGVPQGSILGPLLFLVYLNDLHKAVNNSITYHFADDTELSCWDTDKKRLRNKINSDLNNIFTWLCANRLSLNTIKTEFLIFKPTGLASKERTILKINGKKIYESRKLKYLGLIVDSRLKWNFHISELRKKLGMSFGILYKLKKKTAPLRYLRQVYFSLVQSYLSYGILAWGFASDEVKNPIKILQNKIVNLIDDRDIDLSSKYKSLDILKLDDLIKYNIGKHMWDFENKNLPTSFDSQYHYTSDFHSRLTRQAFLYEFSNDEFGELTRETVDKFFKENQIRTESHGRASLSYHGPIIGNELKRLNLFASSITKATFSLNLRKHLLNLY